MSIRTIITGIRHGQAKEQNIHAGERNDLHVSIHEGEPPLLGVTNRMTYFSQLMDTIGDGTGITNMNATVSDSGTDGAGADHTGPTFVFTSASGGLTGATSIQITDAGAGGNGRIGDYRVVTQTDDNTVALDKDPTNGTDETGLDWNVPTPAIFRLNAGIGFDIRVMKVLIFIGDASITHNAFGGVGALTNGFDLEFVSRGVAGKLLDAVKTTGELIIQSATSLAWGDGNTSFELSNYSGTKDAAVVIIPVHEMIPGGGRIGRDSTDFLRVNIRDDLTGLDDFTIRMMGYKHHA